MFDCRIQLFKEIVMRTVLRGLLLFQAVMLLLVAGASAQPSYPQNLATEFPQFKGCKLKQVMEMPNHLTALMACDGVAIDTPYDFYVDRANTSGYTMLMQNQAADFRIYMAEKGSQVFQLQVSSDNTGTQLGLTLITKDK